MKRDKNLPLTETVYYILLALTEATHGYVLMQRIEDLSNGEVRIAAGTLYGAIETLLRKGFITLMPSDSDDKRRKVYRTSLLGERILREDYERMAHILDISRQLLGKGDEQND